MYIFNEWLRYLDNPKEKRQPHWEFELKCRVHLIGVVDLGWAKFRFWETPPQIVKTDIRSVVLRMNFRESSSEEFSKVPLKKDQHFHPHGPAGEFESLISLFTRAHFVLTRGSFSGNTPLIERFSIQDSVAYSEVDGNEINLRNIQDYFDMMLLIRKSELLEVRKKQPSNRFVKKLIMAARFYHLALSLIENDDSLAYICLVSSIECMLGNDNTTEDFSLQDVNPEAFKLLARAIPNKDEREPIEKAIVKHEPNIKRRFMTFIEDNVSENFWADVTRPHDSFRFRDEKDISLYSGRVYDARSNAIHAGEPFSKSVKRNVERPTWIGMRSGQKEWKEKELIPSLKAFERLVHHVLLESLRKQHSKLKG